MTAVLALHGLGKDYGARTAVAALDLEVARGEIFGLLGPNGAGKTTAISIACGVIAPSRGRVVIDGVALADAPLAAKRKIGLVPQELALYPELSAHENLAYFAALYGLGGAAARAAIDWALGVVALRDRAREPVRRFSGGMQRRLNIAAGLVHRPALLVLDEPTVGVDPQSRNHIFETIRALRDDGMAVVYTTHYMEEVEALCDRVAIMDRGQVVALGTIGELIARYAGAGLELELDGEVAAAARAVASHAAVERTGNVLRVARTPRLAPIVAAIEGAGAAIVRIESRQATLEAAFLAVTGHRLRDAEEDA
ncbi:MAG TPA: ABC transporter ATP-binding protein [Kofleriaceae bacterium]|nr:ABC transporter ATP-binding protein [Kofleriaceae bacterium]